MKRKIKSLIGALVMILAALIMITPMRVSAGSSVKPRSYVYGNVDYSDVFTPIYYRKHNADAVKSAGTNTKKLLAYFATTGVSKGEVGKNEFDVNLYKAKYDDLSAKYGDDMKSYYLDYIREGKKAGRTAVVGSPYLKSITVAYKGGEQEAGYRFKDSDVVIKGQWSDNTEKDIAFADVSFSQDVVTKDDSGRNTVTVSYTTSDLVTRKADFEVKVKVPEVDDSTENLQHDLKVVDGRVMDVVTGKEVPHTVVDGEYFKGDGTNATNLYLGGNWNETIEAVADYDEKNLADPLFLSWDNMNSNESGANVREFGLKFSNGTYQIENQRNAENPNVSHYITIPSKTLTEDGTYAQENMPTGDIFAATSGLYSKDGHNRVSNARVNGASVETIVSDQPQWYSFQKLFGIKLQTTHRIKELKFYSTGRTVEQIAEDYRRTGIQNSVTSTVTGTDGISGLGSPTAITYDANGIPVWTDVSSVKGITTVNGKKTGVAEYNAAPDKAVDNSSYESIHVINKKASMDTGKQYTFSAYPYPMTWKDGTSPEFDVTWSSSNPEVAQVVDGLVIARKAGTTTITAALSGTNLSDSFTLAVADPAKAAEKVYNVPADFKSADGNSFSATDYKMTMQAIFDAITYASENGYNKVVFPKQAFYATAVRDQVNFYVPSNMTIVFPEGSELHMMYNADMMSDATKNELHIFEFGVPQDDYQNHCENSHLVIDKYFGERYEDYKDDQKIDESKYIEEIRFAEFGRKALNCSIEINDAECPAGYFITADGKSADPNQTDGVITYGDMVSGLINQDGSIAQNGNWISTQGYITVPEKIKADGYFLSADGQDSYAGKYHNGATARLYNIYWYDASRNLIEEDDFRGIAEYYDIPANAAFYRVSMQQAGLPTPGSGETSASPWLAMHDNGAAVNCEIRNTNAKHTAAGLFSVVGETDGLWIHHNFVPDNGSKPGDERTGDLENGIDMMRHTVISNNVFTGSAFASGGHNTFLHTNYFGEEVYTRPEDELTHLINNYGRTFILADNMDMDFYYNTATGGIIWNSAKANLKGWNCNGHLHQNYTRNS